MKTAKEYNEKYYTKKAIEYLNEKGIDINEHSLKRAINYIKGKHNIKKYQKVKAKMIDSNLMNFVNEYESGDYYNENI